MHFYHTFSFLGIYDLRNLVALQVLMVRVACKEFSDAVLDVRFV